MAVWYLIGLLILCICFFTIFRLTDFLFTKHPNFIGNVHADIINRAILLKTDNFQVNSGPNIVEYPKEIQLCNLDTINNSSEYPKCYVAIVNRNIINCNFFIRFLGIKCGNVSVPDYIYKIPKLKNKIDTAIKNPCEFAYNPKTKNEVFTYNRSLNRESGKYEYDRTRPLTKTSYGQGMTTRLESPWIYFKCDYWDFALRKYNSNMKPIGYRLLEFKVISTKNNKSLNNSEVVKKNTLAFN